MIRRTIFLAAFFAAFTTSAAEWEQALPGWQYRFPRDLRQHPSFKTEWWYFTGRLADQHHQVFGYELTFFREGIRPPASRGGTTSRFIVNDLKFAHFAVSDLEAKQFHFRQKLSRGAFAEAGFGDAGELAWINDWSLKLLADDTFELGAADGAINLRLRLHSAKPFVVHGENGVSQKAAGVGRASHYFSAARLATTGTLRIRGESRAVVGESWMDREWASNQLAPNQVGWDWFSVQLDDGAELMLYQMRLKNGADDPISSGTLVNADGSTLHLRSADYQLTPTLFWTSPTSGGRYPIGWNLAVPKLDLHLEISTPLRSQELVLRPIVYWEGLINIKGSRQGAAVAGHGYMELTGYTGGPLGLSQ